MPCELKGDLRHRGVFAAFVGPLTAVEATLNDAQPSPGLRYLGAANLI